MKLFIAASLSLVVLASCYDVNAYGGSGFSGETVEIERVIEVEGSGVDFVEVDDLLEKDASSRSRRDTEAVEGETTSEPATTTPTTTTAAPANKTCTAMSKCQDDEDCNGGACVGALNIGKCNCNSCFNFLPCQSDKMCGGLEGACHSTRKICDCSAAFAQHGYPTVVDALQKLCNVKTCKAGDCHGLKCNTGFCTCPAKKN